MWTNIGVELILQPRDTALMSAIGTHWDFENIIIGQTVNVDSLMVMSRERMLPQQVMYYDEWFNETVDKATATSDVDERNAMIKELAVYYIESLQEMPLGNPHLLRMQWPWVKNSYLENEAGYFNYTPMASLIWIDQDLKAEMGY